MSGITNALAHTTSYEYDAAGRLKKVIYPDTNFIQFTYDLAGRRTKFKDPRGHEYICDAVGNRTDRTDHNADRLIGVLKMGGNESYGYDAVGNRTSSHLSTSYSYQGFNKLASTTSATYTYDNNGSQLTKTDGSGTRTLALDPDNRFQPNSRGAHLPINHP